MCHSGDRIERFQGLVSRVKQCDLCPRMHGRQRVLGEGCGAVDSPVLFIGEGPGRLGADRYGIPMYGDQTGRNFDFLLRSVGWDRSMIFITNAVLCNPRNASGHNAPPTLEEIKNCSRYLGELIDLIQPRIIAPLGHYALLALNCLHPHSIRLRYDVGRLVFWNGYKVFPLYHPSPRAMVHRSRAQQVADFYRLARYLTREMASATRRGTTGYAATQKSLFGSEVGLTRFEELIMFILSLLGPCSKFQLAKLTFLCEWEYYKRHGSLLTGEVYLRMANGPVPPVLDRSLRSLLAAGVVIHRGSLYSLRNGRLTSRKLTPQERSFLEHFLPPYRQMDTRRLKTRVYLTPPMKAVLRQERDGRDLLYHPVVFGRICGGGDEEET